MTNTIWQWLLSIYCKWHFISWDIVPHFVSQVYALLTNCLSECYVWLSVLEMLLLWDNIIINLIMMKYQTLEWTCVKQLWRLNMNLTKITKCSQIVMFFKIYKYLWTRQGKINVSMWHIIHLQTMWCYIPSQQSIVPKCDFLTSIMNVIDIVKMLIKTYGMHVHIADIEVYWSVSNPQLFNTMDYETCRAWQ